MPETTRHSDKGRLSLLAINELRRRIKDAGYQCKVDYFPSTERILVSYVGEEGLPASSAVLEYAYNTASALRSVGLQAAVIHIGEPLPQVEIKNVSERDAMRLHVALTTPTDVTRLAAAMQEEPALDYSRKLTEVRMMNFSGSVAATLYCEQRKLLSVDVFRMLERNFTVSRVLDTTNATHVVGPLLNTFLAMVSNAANYDLEIDSNMRLTFEADQPRDRGLVLQYLSYNGPDHRKAVQLAFGGGSRQEIDELKNILKERFGENGMELHSVMDMDGTVTESDGDYLHIKGSEHMIVVEVQNTDVDQLLRIYNIVTSSLSAMLGGMERR